MQLRVSSDIVLKLAIIGCLFRGEGNTRDGLELVIGAYL
jgi:hypothetical protein